MSSCTIVGVPRIMVRYTWQMAFSIFRLPLRSCVERTMAISVPSISDMIRAKMVMTNVLPRPFSMYV